MTGSAAAMHVWNIIRSWFQERIEHMGVEETSFPMFLSAKSLEKVRFGQAHCMRELC
jgi:prolyl-tRNA synthetase